MGRGAGVLCLAPLVYLYLGDSIARVLLLLLLLLLMMMIYVNVC